MGSIYPLIEATADKMPQLLSFRNLIGFVFLRFQRCFTSSGIRHAFCKIGSRSGPLNAGFHFISHTIPCRSLSRTFVQIDSPVLDREFAGGTPTEDHLGPILIVDDSPVIRRVFRRSLGTRYDCFEAGSVIEALAELKERDFALVITDVMMPGLSGIELLRKIIESYPETAVLVVSGVDRPQRALDAVRLVLRYLIKPCDPECGSRS